MPAYPRQKTIAVDVDGTLCVNGTANLALIAWLQRRKAEGYFIFLWSAQGADYAKAVAEKFRVFDLFNVILSKPGYIVDDQGWRWVSFTYWCRSLRDLESRAERGPHTEK